MCETFRNKKVLVTGGAGFIGSRLCSALAQRGAVVTAVDSLIPEYGGNLKNIEQISGNFQLNISDVRDQHSMKYLVRDQDFLFNLAGQTSHLDSMEEPFSDLDTNARAQLSILEACRHNNPDIRIVFASTRQLYGRPEYLPVDEKHPVRPVDVNGVNKLSGEWFHLLYSDVHAIPSTVLRLTNTYGPAMRVKDARQTFLGLWIKNALQEEPIQIFGTGEQKRDFNYVEDVVSALLQTAVAEHSIGEVYNLGSSEVLSLLELAQLFKELRPEVKYITVPFPSELKKIDIGDYYSDFSKIKNTLSWEPEVFLKKGLEQTLNYYERHLKSYL